MIACSIYIYTNYIHTWNPNDPGFDYKRSCFGGFNHQNRGRSQVPGIYIYIRIPTLEKSGLHLQHDQSVTALLLKTCLFRSKAPKGKSRTSKPCPQMVFGTGDDGR